MLPKPIAAATATLATVAALVAMPSEAQACRDICHESYDVVYYYEYKPRVRYRHIRLTPPRWSMGLHLTGLTANHKVGDEAVALGGIGGHLRFRGYRWGAELAVDVLGRDFADGGVTRISVPIQASALLYLIPRGRFNLFMLGGIRVVPTHIRYDLSNLKTEQNFTQFGMQGGIGAELLLSRWFALTADIRAFGVVRNDNDSDGQYYTGVERPIVAEKAVGLQFNVGASLRF
ncbi:MAG: hypothetical protein KC503_34990 [Myxococcales bacterium]|nr:hypothetical protein [Myxococcales bacterium]